MAQQLMHDDQAAEELRRGSKWAERAAGGSEGPTSAETSKAEAKADKKKEPASYKGSLTAGYEAVTGAGKKVADALVPPPGAPARSVGERGVEAGTGVAEIAGGFFAPIQQLIHNVVAAGGGDAEMPKPIARVLNAAMHLPTAVPEVTKELFSGSQEEHDRLQKQYDADTQAALDKPLTWADGLSMIGATAVGGKLATAHGAEAPVKGAKPAETLGARFAKEMPPEEPPAAAAQPALPPDPGPFPKNGTLKEKNAWNDAQKAYRAAQKQQQAAPAPAPAPAAAPEPVPAVERRVATGESPTGVERRAVHEGTVPPAEALGVEPIPEAVNPDTAELQASLSQDHAILSAERSHLTPEENATRTAALKADIEALGINPTPAEGVYGGSKENSFLAQGMSLEQAQELGRKYEQESVIHNGDLHYTTGENAGKVRKNLGTTFDVPPEGDGTRIGNARFSNSYDWDAEPSAPGEPVAQAQPGEVAPEPAQPASEAPEAAPVPAEEGAAAEQAAPEATGPLPEETQPVIPEPVPYEEPAAPPEYETPPPVNTVADLHANVVPHVEAAVADAQQAAMLEAQIRAEAVRVAQEMRAAGASRADIHAAFKAKLNENGIRSKAQLAEDAALAKQVSAPEPTAGGEIIDEPTIAQQIASIRARMRDIAASLGGGETGAINVKGDIAGLKKQAGPLWEDMRGVGAAMLHMGAREFGDWSAKMVEALGPEVKPHLGFLYAQSQKTLKALNDNVISRPLPSVEKLREAMASGAPGFDWYDQAPAEIRARFGANADTFARAYAATSQMTNAATSNISNAVKAYNMIVSGEKNGTTRPFTGKEGWGVAAGQVASNLNRVAQGLDPTGPKINQFAQVLRGEPGARNVSVNDTWVYRGFGFMPDEGNAQEGGGAHITRAQTQFVHTIFDQIAKETGADVAQVQAAFWVDIKASVERQRAIDKFMASPNADVEALTETLRKINNAATPLHQLLENRLGPIAQAARQGDLAPGAGDRLVARRATAAIMERPADPENAVMASAMSLGMDEERAAQVAENTVEALRAQGMDDGAGGIDLTKQENVPYDRVGANRALAEKVRNLCP